MRISFILIILLLCVGMVSAQSGTYSYFGSGCNGTGGTGLYQFSSNPNGGTLGMIHNSNIFAVKANPIKIPTIVLGFELFTKAVSGPVNIQTQIYMADAAGKPTGNPVKIGVMNITSTTAGWWRTTFTSPLILQPNTAFFLSYTSTTQMYFPILSGGGTKSIHYWHGPTATTWSGPFTTQAWSWRVITPGGGSKAPVIGNAGVPTVGKGFTVNLSNALANTPAVMTLGFSNQSWSGLALPFSLTPMGAPNCSVFSSIAMVMPATVSSTGVAAHVLNIPNNPLLLGGTFYNQWIVADAQANSLGLAFTGGGAGTPGK